MAGVKGAVWGNGDRSTMRQALVGTGTKGKLSMVMVAWWGCWAGHRVTCRRRSAPATARVSTELNAEQLPCWSAV